MSSFEERLGKKSYLDRLRPGEIKVDPELWGPRSAEVEEFLANEYDPKTMPMLAAADVNGREGAWLLGWETDGTSFPPLLAYLFGSEYNREQMFRIKMRAAKQPLEAEGRFGMHVIRVRPEGTA